MSVTHCHISIVDDEESVCRAIQRLLRSVHMEGRTFASGEAFLRWHGDNGTDCIILDLHMPGTTGFEVLERIVAEGSHTPVIVITGHDSPETRDRAMAAGATRYLCKPVNDEVLLEAVREATGVKET